MIVLDTVAHVSDAVSKQLKIMSEFAVEDYFPPVAKEETPRAMPADSHFATFVAALIETLEYGMEGAPPVCEQRVATLRSELEQVQKLVKVYLRRHFDTLAEHSVKVRQLPLSNMNIGQREGMKALAVQGGELYTKHTCVAQAPGTGNSMVIPTLEKLRALAEEDDESSLAERSAHWRPNTAGASGVKRKGAPGAGGKRAAPAQGRAGGGGHPLQGPNAALEDACGGVLLHVAWPPLREAYLFVCTRPACRKSRAAAAAAAAAASAAAAATPTAAATAADATGRGSSRGAQEGVEQEGRGRTPCALAGTTCPLAGGAGEWGMAAITDCTGSAVRQGRPMGGQGRWKRGVSSQMPRGPWDFAMHPYPGRCRRPCFMVRISCPEEKSVQYTSERLKKNLGNRCGGRKKHAVTAVVSLNRSTQAGRTRMRRNSKSDQRRYRNFQQPQCKKVQNSRPCVSRDEGCLIPLTEQTSVARNSHTTAQNRKLCVSRDEGYLISRTDQILVGRNSHPTAQNSRLCVSRDERYLISRTDHISVVRNSHTTAQNSRLCVSRDEGCLISTDQLSVARNFHTTAQNSRLCVSRDEGYLMNSHTTAQNSRLCLSRDQGYLISRTDQLSVVRNSHATPQNRKLCVSSDEDYLISRTDQLSVVRNPHTTAQNSRLCASRDEGCLISRTDQLSVVRNSHTTAQNSRLCVSRDEDCLTSRTDQLSVRNSHTAAQNSRLCVSRDHGYLYFVDRPVIGGAELSHTTAAQNRRLRVSSDEGCLISQTGQTSVMRNSHTTAQISRSTGPEYPTSARVGRASIA